MIIMLALSFLSIFGIIYSTYILQVAEDKDEVLLDKARFGNKLYLFGVLGSILLQFSPL